MIDHYEYVEVKGQLAYVTEPLTMLGSTTYLAHFADGTARYVDRRDCRRLPPKRKAKMPPENWRG